MHVKLLHNFAFSHRRATNLNFYVMPQGSAATYLRCSDKYHVTFVRNFLLFLLEKNFENLLKFDRVKGKKGSHFLAHCVNEIENNFQNTHRRQLKSD